MKTRTCRGPDPRPGRLRRLAPAGWAAAVLLASGCVATDPMTWVQNGFKVGPNYHRPPAPVAEEWIEANDARVRGGPRDDDWWNVFQDPALNSLIYTAYRQNPNLRAVGTRVLQARAQQAIAVGEVFPQVQQATGQYSRIALSKTTANNPAVIAGRVPAGLAMPFDPLFGNWFSDWAAGFNVSWELDFWGRYRRAVESANGSLDASVENYDAALVTLLADVATNYVQYRVAQQRIKIAEANLKKQAEIVAKVQKQFNVGTTAEGPLKQLQTLLEQTRSTIPALQISLGQANDALCTLLGIPPRDLEPELGPGPELGADPMPNTPDWVAAGVPADLLRRRPDVRSAERQVAAQSAQIGVAEADLYPTIFINGAIGLEAESLSRLFESRSFMGNITPQFRWNILNYGRITNNLHLQEARTQELIAAYQNRALAAAQEVQTALRGFLKSQKQAKNLTDSVDAAVRATEIADENFDKLKALDPETANRLFTLHITQLQEQDNLAVAQGNVALDLINVYRALGGGWEIRGTDGHGCKTQVADVAPEQTPPAAEREPLPHPKSDPQPP
jgi:NodT family efflux transporter outer membrane factor (OMF) lipoprotein